MMTAFLAQRVYVTAVAAGTKLKNRYRTKIPTRQDVMNLFFMEFYFRLREKIYHIVYPLARANTLYFFWGEMKKTGHWVPV
jgi:hypothetical protein